MAYPTMKIDFFDAHFSSRTALRAHLRHMRGRWHRKGPITGRDHEFLLALFALHPNAAIKAPNGVDHFEARWAESCSRGNTRCFWVVDKNGSTAEFSTNKAIKAAYTQLHLSLDKV